MRHSILRRLGAAATFFAGVAALSSPALALDCAQLAAPVYQSVNPVTQTNLLSPWASEIATARERAGFTDVRGEVFRAAAAPGADLAPVHRLYKSGTSEFVWIASPAEIAGAVANYGYVDQGVNFYAATGPAACAQPVYRLLKAGAHRQVASETERDALVAAGWRYEQVSFYAARTAAPPADTRFSVAIIPDTQNEVQQKLTPTSTRRLNDWRLQFRNQWLVDNRAALKLAFVGHTGDLVSFGENEVAESPEFEQHQYKIAASGMEVLWNAGLPFAIAQGNHDTRAVCWGGSACPGRITHDDLRLAPLFNQYFGNRFSRLVDRMKPGELQNHYSVFQAGGRDWLVLVVEFMPRQEAVNWAQGVIAAHPKHNVIVLTHAFIDGGGNLIGGNDGYGDKSPAWLWDSVLKVYPNVKFVFSGHTGTQARRTLTGTSQNRVEAFNQTFHDGTYAPVRIVEIDTATDSGRSYVVKPAMVGATTSMIAQPAREYEVTFDGMAFVR